jgi:hypothetical protein
VRASDSDGDSDSDSALVFLRFVENERETRNAKCQMPNAKCRERDNDVTANDR